MYYQLHKKVGHMGPTIFISNANLYYKLKYLEPCGLPFCGTDSTLIVQSMLKVLFHLISIIYIDTIIILNTIHTFNYILNALDIHKLCNL